MDADALTHRSRQAARPRGRAERCRRSTRCSTPTSSRINPERVAPILRRLVSPTRTRARIYDRDGTLVIDSRHLYARGQILGFDLPPPAVEAASLLDRVWQTINLWLQRSDLPLYKELGGANGKGYPEVVSALDGTAQSIVRVTDTRRADRLGRGADPALPHGLRRRCSCRPKAATSTPSSMPSGWRSSASSSSPPPSRCCFRSCSPAPSRRRSAVSPTPPTGSAAAMQIAARDSRLQPSRRRDRPSQPGGPRHDHLALQPHRGDRELRRRRRARAQESADLAAERGRDPAARQDRGGQGAARRHHPARRPPPRPADQRHLQRLAPRCRARPPGRRPRSTSARCWRPSSTMVRDTTPAGRPEIPARHRSAPSPEDYFVLGHDIRLGQVFNNLIDNARSFCRKDGTVRVRLRPMKAGGVEVTVDDDGPGIRADQFERIFERFYTDRPDQESFGQNSGLGLSISQADRRGPSRHDRRREPDPAGARRPASRRRFSARASPCGCRPNERCPRRSTPPPSLIGERRRADPRRVGQRQVVARPRPARPRSRRRPGWSPTTGCAVAADHGRLVAAAPPALAGKLEIRGQGIVAAPMSRRSVDRAGRRSPAAGRVPAHAGAGGDGRATIDGRRPAAADAADRRQRRRRRESASPLGASRSAPRTPKPQFGRFRTSCVAESIRSR